MTSHHPAASLHLTPACMHLLMLFAFLPALPGSPVLASAEDSFGVYRDKYFQSKAGDPPEFAAIRPPLREGRGPWSRHYSYSVMNFALRAFWLDEFNEEANTALRENCQFYIDNPLVRQEHDAFYWSTDLLFRIVEFFGRNGSRNPGLLHEETEALIEKMVWLYCDEASLLEDAEYAENLTWDIILSDNHQIQQIMTIWHGLLILSRTAEYRERTLRDGGTLQQHLKAWTAYSKEYFRERVRKGIFVEFASKGYGAVSIKSIHNYYDFAPEPELRRLAGAMLDLFWATRAEETIDGVRGGAAARVYHGPAALSATNDRVGRYMGLYYGEGYDIPPRDNEYSLTTSRYRIPQLILDMARDADGRGVYEIRQRRMGAVIPGGVPGGPVYRVYGRGDNNLLRYTFATPDFVMGTAIFPADSWKNWTLISSQNRWQGVTFRGHPDARIVPECEPLQVTPNITPERRPPNRSYHGWYSMQHRGALITQSNPGGREAGGMRVWFSEAGLTSRGAHHGWQVTESEGAFAAVRMVSGGHRWETPPEQTPRLPEGRWLYAADPGTAVIIEVVRKEDFPDLSSFTAALEQTQLEIGEGALDYTSLEGAVMRFYTDGSSLPRIDGQEIDLNPPHVFDSPHIQSLWNSGKVKIRHGGEKLKIDVNSSSQPES